MQIDRDAALGREEEEEIFRSKSYIDSIKQSVRVLCHPRIVLGGFFETMVPAPPFVAHFLPPTHVLVLVLVLCTLLPSPCLASA